MTNSTNNSKIIEATKNHIKQLLAGEGSGHDWWHILRVWTMAKHIAVEEKNVDMTLVELGALLHDVADWKFHAGSLEAGPKAAREWLMSLHADQKLIEDVCHIVEHVSYKGAGEKNLMESPEGLIVQDADRLDALGAMGIARVFMYGGHAGREMYNPDIQPQMHASFEEYKKSAGPAINHFYEKLLLLKDRMNTKTGKKIAKNRHAFMEEYLKEFYAEWDGEK